jgi:hypothetical protein
MAHYFNSGIRGRELVERYDRRYGGPDSSRYSACWIGEGLEDQFWSGYCIAGYCIGRSTSMVELNDSSISGSRLYSWE